MNKKKVMLLVLVAFLAVSAPFVSADLLDWINENILAPVVSYIARPLIAAPVTLVQAIIDWVQGESFGDSFYEHWVDNALGGIVPGFQTASYTIRESASQCENDYCGDCKAHSVLRAALLRSLGVSHYCIFSARFNPSEENGHLYNIVNYRNAYRVMDYGEIYQYFFSRERIHVTFSIFNDHFGKYLSEDALPSEYTYNYPGNPGCPSVWSDETYYKDICPDIYVPPSQPKIPD